METFRIGVDIGGTFTDVVIIDESGHTASAKALTTHKDLSLGVIIAIKEVLEQAGKAFENASIVIHGTTLVGNALIERKGVKTALLTTKGFRDQIEISTTDRYDPNDLFLERAKPLVPRHLRIPVTERILADGSVLTPLDDREVEVIARHLQSTGVKAVAVSFLHSYKYPVHELKAGQILRRVAPEMAVSLSSDIVPEIREYQRTTTACANVYVQGLVTSYLSVLESRLQNLGFTGELLMMLSGGGTATVETAAKFPVRLLESGPVGGALTASFYSIRCALDNLLVFDMGGTTAKVTFVEAGEPLTTSQIEVAHAHRFKKGSGIPIRIPAIEMIEIGAGGGSIARLDLMNLVKVGPESAGSDPGPACYGSGGLEPTVTDADLVLGYLDPEYFLGGRMKLDPDASWRAIELRVAGPLGIGIVDAAFGIHRIVNESMAGAARIHAIERGKDIREYPIFALGGAGPVHAAGVARILGVPRVVSPVGAGVASAFGFLTAPLAFEFVQSHQGPLMDQNWETINKVMEGMEDSGIALLVEAGVPKQAIKIRRSGDLRYMGQNYELLVQLPREPLNDRSSASIKEIFDQRYRELYAGISEALPVEVLSWRVSVSGPRPEIQIRRRSGKPHIPDSKGLRPMYLPKYGDLRPSPVYDRNTLSPGATMTGPLIVESRESTMIVTDESVVKVDDFDNLIVEIG